MKTALRKMGNSQGILIPKPILAELGLEGAAEMTVEDGALVLRPIRLSPRQNWADASKALAEAQDDALVWPQLGNAGDGRLKW